MRFLNSSSLPKTNCTWRFGVSFQQVGKCMQQYFSRAIQEFKNTKKLFRCYHLLSRCCLIKTSNIYFISVWIFTVFKRCLEPNLASPKLCKFNEMTAGELGSWATLAKERENLWQTNSMFISKKTWLSFRVLENYLYIAKCYLESSLNVKQWWVNSK